jgi:N utilization substance protein B
MLKKRKTRELAMQTLFLWDAAGGPDMDVARQLVTDGTEDHDVRRAAVDMANGTWGQREQIDAWVERLAPQWPPRRQPGVDRNLIRLAVWELTNTDTPPKVVLDEAIELAKEFSTEQSPAFVNGVLDSILKEKRALSGEPTAQEAAPQVPPPGA